MAEIAYRRHTDVIAELIPLAGRRVVDVGCGDGKLVRWFARNGAAWTTGVECGDAQLAKARAGDPAPNVEIVKGRGEALPLDNGSADVVVFFNSLHHVPVADQATALREARRVLATDGLLYIAEPLADGDSFELSRLVDDETAVRAAAYKQLLAAPGLAAKVEAIYLTPYVRRSFEDWREESVRIDPKRKAAFETHAAELRRLFDTLGRPDETGRAFDQPMRVNLLRKTR